MTASQKGLPMFRFLNWYFLLATNYFLYGESMISHYAESSMPSCQTLTPLPIPIRSVLVDRFLLPLATHHRFISFSLYCMGFVLFILSLKKGTFHAALMSRSLQISVFSICLDAHDYSPRRYPVIPYHQQYL